ncbi:hypothetical protein BU23DRAFT_550063 [Bimuria novae-zelandiae CBS 107.79]|uniref:Uncharacterized protein n=1 Tax=Bimuria novae-zelandiae CBS 107.79 TaxID=1447943 RepID=A0A6A5VUW1_9PLEO|nr:hypothetical protein BU23DRAFT_550063 [Bimuria novae-zelandiae CBS 107.79]
MTEAVHNKHLCLECRGLFHDPPPTTIFDGYETHVKWHNTLNALEQCAKSDCPLCRELWGNFLSQEQHMEVVKLSAVCVYGYIEYQDIGRWTIGFRAIIVEEEGGKQLRKILHKASQRLVSPDAHGVYQKPWLLSPELRA